MMNTVKLFLFPEMGDGNILAVGGGWEENGAIVRVVERNQTVKDWSRIGDIIRGVDVDDNFEMSIALSADGNHLAHGLPPSETDRVRAYERIDDEWVRFGADIPAEPGNDGLVSVALSADGMTVAFGMKFGETTNGENSGRVRIYRFIEGNASWHQLGIDLNGRDLNSYFGTCVSLSADGSHPISEPTTTHL